MNRYSAAPGGRRPSGKEREKRRQRRILLRKGIVLMAALGIVAAIALLIRGCVWMIYQRRSPQLTDWEYAPLASDYAGQYDVPIEVVYAVIETESHFDENAQSPVGACGLMQLMPDTYDWIRARLGEKETALVSDGASSESKSGTHTADGIFDPETNIRYGVYYLSYLHGLFGNWETAYAGYNAGPNIVRKWLQDTAYSSDGVTLDSIPYTETANYVVKVSTARERYEELFDE